MNKYYIKLADKNQGLWAIEDRGPTGAIVVKTYTTKKVTIKCPSYTCTPVMNCHYLVVEGNKLSFGIEETIIE